MKGLNQRLLRQGLDRCLSLALRPGTALPLRLITCDGVQHDFGPEPRVTVRLQGPAALRSFLSPSLDRLADAYVHGRFDVDGPVDEVVAVAAALAQAASGRSGALARLLRIEQHDRSLDARAIAYHYDVSNAFYQLWLDPALVYSCAYFPTGQEALEAAQQAKLDHVLTKIGLQPGERLLDIGCGWGALALRAAQCFGAQVVGITLSKNQHALACEQVQRAGLADRVELRLQDYRELDPREGLFDKITSIGMFEHVGLAHLGDYFRKIQALLKPGGLVMNHGITTTDPGNGAAPLGADAFISRYVFPHGELPHIGLVLQRMQEAGLEALDAECLRRHYERTLTLWSQRYEAQSDAIRTQVDEQTFRIWRIYLAGCAYAFAQNWVSLYQVLACQAGADAQLNPTPWSRAYMYPTGAGCVRLSVPAGGPRPRPI